MFRFPQIRFDNFSFLLGIVFALVLWWVFTKLREMIKKQRSGEAEKEADLSQPIPQKESSLPPAGLSTQKLQNNIADVYRRELFFHAQKQHLGAKYCPLQEILIEPDLIAAPYEVDPLIPFPPETLTSQIVPYLPDFPDFISQFPFPRIAAIDALRNGVNIIVYGAAGSGKSVVLANLVSKICVETSAVDEVRSRIPIYLDWLDLDFNGAVDGDAFDVLLAAVNTQNFLKSRNNCLAYLQQSLTTNKFLLVLDGLDSLHPDEFQVAVKFLEILIRQHPNIQFITTASADFLDGFHRMETRAFCVASWSTLQRSGFCEKWMDIWNRYIANTKAEKNDESTILIKKWLDDENKILSPFEWTLRLWGLSSGKLKGLETGEMIEAFLESISGNSFNAQNVAVYANDLLEKRKSALPYSQSEKLLSKNPKANPNDLPDNSPQGKASKQKKIASSGEIIIRNFIDNGVASLRGKDTFCIHHPLITAYCATLVSSTQEGIFTFPLWSMEYDRLRFKAAKTQETPEINAILENEDLPLHRNLLTAGRLIKDAPLESRWRVNLMRRLVYLIKQDTLPLSLRASFMAVAVASRDASLSVLFKQLFTSPSPVVRRISALGAGAARDKNVTQELIRLMGDQSLEVRCTACLALANIPGSAAWQAVIDALIKGEEHLQQVAAESLAWCGERGYDVLRNSVTDDNILVRRASVIGFSQVNQKWCISLLEKIAVEDGQWVVRNAASQALEMIHQKNVYIPRHIPRPEEAGWLVQFAAKQGTTLAEGEFPKAMLLQVLGSGNQEEKLAALNYLRFVPDENILKSFYDIFYAEQTPQRDTVFQYLWWMMVSGVRLPSPIQYGYK